MSGHSRSDSLRSIITGSESAVIALSGGTDSTFLVSIAAGVNGLRLMAITVSTPYMFSSEVNNAADFCRSIGVKHLVIEMDMPQMIVSNPPDRCYLCKREVMKAVTTAAAEGGYSVVFDGTNADDLNDYRPGIKALRELGIRSPLAEAGLTKEEIRELARQEGLEVSDRPSNTCLLTRFPHDTVITPGILRRAEEAERIVTQAGLAGARVRIHGDLVRIECTTEHFAFLISTEIREKISAAIKELGYKYITIDAEGYRSGSMK
jgi:uncharacterized protein